MPKTLELGNKQVALDDDGYLVNFEDWDEEVAQELAKRNGAHPLDTEQLDILRFLREYYKKHENFPIMRAVCKNVHQPKDCLTQDFLEPMTAWKVSGLPNPGPVLDIAGTWEMPPT